MLDLLSGTLFLSLSVSLNSCLLSQNLELTSYLQHTDLQLLFFLLFSANPSPVMHIFLVCVCGGGGGGYPHLCKHLCACVHVCV